MISNILKLNRLENQSIVPCADTYDLSRQLCDCILMFENIWEEKDIEMDIDIEERTIIRSDESLTELVWNNLLANALKFTKSGGMVSVKQITSEKGISIVVSDSGCGMSEESVKHIFDKFYQGDRSRRQEGSGLGLPLAKRVVELCGGALSVESRPGQGSTFTVTLPV